MQDIVLEMKGVTKRFGSLVANDSVDFDLRKGEVHALLGENGAGKTTLMNCLYGIYRQEEGDIFYKGQKLELNKSKLNGITDADLAEHDLVRPGKALWTRKDAAEGDIE